MKQQRVLLLLLPSIIINSLIIPVSCNDPRRVPSQKLWHELGRGIGNEGLHDLAGYAVASSKSGYTVAVASPLYTTTSAINTNLRAGRVRVYRYNSRKDGWSKIGQDLEGDSIGDEFGSSLSLNDSGNVIAIGSPNCMREGKRERGCVQVYELDIAIDPDGEEVEVWERFGNTILGHDAFDHFGHAIEIKMKPDISSYLLVVGAPGARVNSFEVGVVYVYNYSWSQTDEDGNRVWTFVQKLVDNVPASYSNFGSAISVTDDTKYIAVGAPNSGDKSQGAVRLFYGADDPKQWSQIDSIESDVTIHRTNDNCGTSVSLDSLGKYLAYGCSNANHEDKLRVGKVRILTRSSAGSNVWSNQWISQAQIVGENEGDEFGTSVQLSDITESSIFLAVGAPNNSPVTEGINYVNAGHLRVYSSIGDGNWEQAGLDVEGLAPNHLLGSSVAINGEGHIVITGAPNGGYAKVFMLAYTSPPSPAPSYNFNESNSPLLVWVYFLISILAIGLLGASYVIMKKLRTQRSFSNVTNEDDDIPKPQVHVPSPFITLSPKVLKNGVISVI